MKKSLDIQVIGKVQGVWFRKNTQNVARKLGIKGTVRNLDDGSVFIEAEGEEEPLEQFVDWCRVGPSAARVDDLKNNETEVRGFTDFKIIH